ncbi:MAG: lysophospholipid acyltransferase family protein [Spirochaetota bacterium]
METASLPWPRKRLARAFSRGVLRLLFRLFARVEVQGEENVPATGPCIVAGNHSGFLDVLLMIAFGPPRLEMIGTGDIPMDPSYAKLTEFYGFIPIKRGSTDSQSLEKSVDVLRQGGFLGIFPQGGVWDRRRTRAQRGVAWIGAAAHAPVLPMGFGGVQGAFAGIFSLRFPRISVGIGPPIPMPAQGQSGEVRKGELDAFAERVMDAVESLIPGDLRGAFEAPEREDFDAKVEVQGPAGSPLPVELSREEARSLGFLLFHQVLVRTFRRNLRLRVACLEDAAAPISGATLGEAMGDLVRYLDEENRYFFTYRIGAESAVAIRGAFGKILVAAETAPEATFRIEAERSWRMAGDTEDRVERLGRGI